MPDKLDVKKIKKYLKLEENQCPVERAMRILGGKWKASILFHLKEQPLRFNELSRQLPGASKKILNQRLQEMEELGFVKRTVKAAKPIAVEYSTTPAGVEALSALDGVRDWAAKHNI